MNKQKVLGTMKEAKGRMEQAAGAITGIPALEKEGVEQRAIGKLEAKVGDAREKLEKITAKVVKDDKK